MAGLVVVIEERLRLSRSPAAEMGAAAQQAQDAAGVDACDFIVIAVPAGTAGEVTERLDKVRGLELAPGE